LRLQWPNILAVVLSLRAPIPKANSSNMMTITRSLTKS
jgi:hypothetical protein